MKDQVKAALAILLVGALGYVVYVQVEGKPLLPGASGLAAGAEPDTTKLAQLKEVQSITVAAVLGHFKEYDQGGRNIFQYGPPKPPPPTPAEIEAARKAEEARLKVMEEEARQRAEAQQKQAQEEGERRAREAADAIKKQQESQVQTAAAGPKGPATPPPPPINYKLVGYLGPIQKRIAVLMNGTDIVLGRQGDVLEGKFRLLKIGIDSVEIGYSDPAFKDARKKIDLGT